MTQSHQRRAVPAIAALTLATLTVLSAQDFIAPVSYPAPNGVTYWSVSGDFNGDGLTDLACADGAIANNIAGFFFSYGLPGGGFGPVTARPIGNIVQAIAAADVNNDSKTDIVVTTPAGVAVLNGAAAGFSSPIYLSLGGLTVNYAAVADFNRDGRPDIVAAGNTGYAVALGTASGAFTIGQLFPQATSSFYVLTGDFNNDGFQDFVGSGGIGSVTYLGDGTGNFPTQASSQAITWGAKTAQLNGDGLLDIVMTTAQPRQDGSNEAVTVLLGRGDGGFVGYSNFVINAPISQLAVGDFNADGRPDVALRTGNTSKIRVLPGNGTGSFGFNDLMPNSLFYLNGIPLTADVDNNGSPDIVFSHGNAFEVYRTTHGNPPLLSRLQLNPASVIGGAANTTATISLGGPAPATGVTVSLASDSTSAFFPGGATVTIVPGATSATFSIATSGVAQPTTANITATANGVSQITVLSIVPAYTLSGLTVNPASQYGIFNVTGTLTLNGTADSSAVVSLTSANSTLASVPATVAVPAGATSVNFTIRLSPVTVDTPVALSAAMGGITLNSQITVLKPADVVALTKGIYTAKTAELKIDATSTNAAAVITVYNPNTGALLGTLTNAGRGKYTGSVFIPSTMTTVTLKSSRGGTVTSRFDVKI